MVYGSHSKRSQRKDKEYIGVKKMKKIVLLLLVILTIGIGFGCKNNPTKNNDPIFPNEKTDEAP